MKISKFQYFFGWLIVVNIILNAFSHNISGTMGWITSQLFWASYVYTENLANRYKELYKDALF